MPAPRLTVRRLMGLVALAGLGLGLDSIPSGRRCGRFPVHVNLTAPGRSIKAVAAGAVSSVEEAKAYLDLPGGPSDLVDRVTWMQGFPFDAWIPYTVRTSWVTGRRLTFTRFHALILRIDEADGTRRWLVCTVPDPELSRSLTVHLP